MTSRELVTGPRLALALSLGLLIPPPRARAQEEPVLLKLPAATLAEAFAALGREHDLKYLVANGRGQPKKVAVAGDSMRELVLRLLGVFGASGAEIDGLWFVDGAPPADRGEAIIAAAPGQIRDVAPSRAIRPPDERRADIDELRRLWDPYKARIGLPPEGQWRLVPFEVKDPEQVQRLLGTGERGALGLSRLRDMVRRPRRPLAGASLKLEAPGTLRLVWEHRAGMSLPGRVGPEAGDGLPPVQEQARLPYLESRWLPNAVRNGRAQIPAIVVGPTESSGSLGGLLADLAGRLPAAFSAGEAAETAIDARLPDMPLWALLEALSVATGRVCECTDDFATYEVAPPTTHYENAAFAAMEADERLMYLQLDGAGAAWLAVDVWTRLTEAQRQALEEGQVVKLEVIPAEALRWVERADAHVRATRLASEARRLEEFLAQESRRGVFILNAAGSLYLRLWVSDGEFLGYHLVSALGDAPQIPAAADVREERLRFLSSPIGLYSDRWRVPALPPDYGTRDEAGPHAKRRHEPALIAGPVNAEAGGLR